MEKGFLPTSVDKVVDPFVDIGNLLICDNDPLECTSQGNSLSEDEILVRTRDNTQYLFNKLWELDRQRVEDAVVVKLPAVTFRLPREKVLPQKRELTRWEQFAKEKGIQKRKKDSKMYDNTTGEWKPRYGYRRGRDDTKDWLIEIPDNKGVVFDSIRGEVALQLNPMVDYFAERENDKKERRHKNELQRLRNIKRQMKSQGGNASESVASLGISKDLQDRSKHELVNQMNRARQATASMGKFQPMLKNEKVVKAGVKRKFKSNESDVTSERERYMEILNRISSKKAKLSEAHAVAIQQRAENSSKDAASKTHRKGAKLKRKSAIHRQQYYQHNVKTGKHNRKNVKGKK